MRRSRMTLACAVLVFSGCLDYTFETTVRPDGGGVRHERMEVTRNDDFDLSADALLALTRSGAVAGWSRSVQTQADGDTTWIQERRLEFAAPADWTRGDGAPILLAALPERADDRLGSVRLGDVKLRSSIQVRRTPRSDGSVALAYREAWVWEGAADVLVEFLLRGIEESLVERFPRVSARSRGEILGYARARIWDAGEDGLFFDENTDELTARAVGQITDHALRVIRTDDPDVRRDRVADVFARAFAFDDEDENRRFEELLPGLNLAFNTSVVFRLTMPGSITTTNADRRDGSVLEWEFSPLDDLRAPIEIVAESVIRP